jgi:hypothetical protein
MLNDLKFADDIDVLEEERDKLHGNLKRINEIGEAAGLQINTDTDKDNYVRTMRH